MWMAMRWWTPALFVSSVALHAQIAMTPGIARGRLVAWTGSARGGEIQIRNTEGLRSCRFDARTYFERDYVAIAVGGLDAGDPLEVVADRKPGSAECYARTVQVVAAHAQRFVPGVRPPLRMGPNSTEWFAPRGDFTFGGRVVQRDGQRLTVMTRSGQLHLVLRPDTRYLGGGLSVEAASLPVNTHVFVRAGRDVDGLLEAYQIIWGEMIAPQ
jgi:hypothetical protein